MRDGRGEHISDTEKAAMPHRQVLLQRVIATLASSFDTKMMFSRYINVIYFQNVYRRS